MNNKSVLIVDKSTFVRIMISTLLKNVGCMVIGTADNVEDAINKYMDYEPDITFIDIDLNGFDGIDLTRRIKKINPFAIVIVFVPKSEDTSELVVESIRAGATGYINKPISKKSIQNQIN
ncbi:MAG: response regulator [Methanosarcinales archaeon]|jgi:DNA-binding NarL/FixJ family response regulator|nr:response regulator [Methanosarcinales archaeon]